MKDELRKLFRFVIALISTLFVIVLVWILIDCFSTKRISTNRIISFNIKEELDYFIKQNNNIYYTDDEANENNIFISEYVDSIDIDFNYNLKGNKLYNDTYSYNIIFELNSYKDNKSVWNYVESVIPFTKESYDEVNNVNISDSLTFDLNRVKELANNYKNITGNDCDLKIKIYIDNLISINGYEKVFNENSVLELYLPITKKSFSITKNFDGDYIRRISEKVEEHPEFNNFIFLFSFLLLIAILPVTITSYVSLFNFVVKDSYNRKYKIIKSKFSDRLEVVKKIPVYKKKEIVEVDDYKIIYDFANDNDSKIYMFEKEKGRECWFYTVEKEDVLLFILKYEHERINMRDNSYKFDIINNREE